MIRKKELYFILIMRFQLEIFASFLALLQMKEIKNVENETLIKEKVLIERMDKQSVETSKWILK